MPSISSINVPIPPLPSALLQPSFGPPSALPLSPPLGYLSHTPHISSLSTVSLPPCPLPLLSRVRERTRGRGAPPSPSCPSLYHLAMCAAAAAESVARPPRLLRPCDGRAPYFISLDVDEFWKLCQHLRHVRSACAAWVPAREDRFPEHRLERVRVAAEGAMEETTEIPCRQGLRPAPQDRCGS